MLYQLSYSRSTTYGWWGLQVTTRLSIRHAVNPVSIARAMPVPEASLNSARWIHGRQRGLSQETQLGFRVFRKGD